MADSVFLAELSWPEYKTKIEAGAPVILAARRDRAARAAPRAERRRRAADGGLPSASRRRSAASSRRRIPYGYKSQPRSGGGEAFRARPASTRNTFALVVRDVIRGLGRHGVRRIVVLNGHFENSWPSVEGVDLGLARAAPRRHRRHAGDAARILGFRPPRDARQAVPGRLSRHRARACEPARDLADAAACGPTSST